MNILSQFYSVLDYCVAMDRNEIIVNRQYQRNDAVWPDPAKSFLVETILLGYPIPKLYLYQVTDIKSKRAHKEIVDGQQRSQAIFDFYSDQFRLGRSLQTDEFKGRKFSQLSEESQAAFLSYNIPVDLFVSATPDDIREVFRRMNSYTVPLNPEEQRHAEFQGDFKWFIYQLSTQYDQSLVSMGLFGDKQLVRMADAKLYSEIAHALLHGITTTNKTKLTALYRENDKSFPEVDSLEARFHQMLRTLISLTQIYGGPLMKPYIVYSLLLAITHCFSPVGVLEHLFRSPRNWRLNRRIVIANLLQLQEALNEPERPGRFKEFVLACEERTNVASQREIRFRWLCRALQAQAL